LLRLGEGVDARKRLAPTAMERVIQVLKEWHDRVEAHSVDAVVVVATSAVRDAQNRQEFLDRIRREVGWGVEVLTGEEEARRTLLGIRFGLPDEVREFAAVDIGGGSTEFIRVGSQGSVDVISLDLGVVRLTERAFMSDPPTAVDLARAEKEIVRQLEAATRRYAGAWPPTLVGTAGTITTLAAMDQGLSRYDTSKVHNYVLSYETVRNLEKAMTEKACAQRVGMPGLEPGREQVIVAGTVILRTIMERLAFPQCLVSDFGLREGILVDRAMRQP
jgi:exopolyphosphatase / guanosine-5'-triphosphate,3'-diphosphate pyrophosphatase